jgi:hypothetical protein
VGGGESAPDQDAIVIVAAEFTAVSEYHAIEVPAGYTLELAAICVLAD